jgi:hypothetical protein
MPQSKPARSTMKGPYTIRRDELAGNYRWKAENIVRFFDNLGMSRKARIKFLSEELAQAYMHGEDKQKGLQLLTR